MGFVAYSVFLTDSLLFARANAGRGPRDTNSWGMLCRRPRRNRVAASPWPIPLVIPDHLYDEQIPDHLKCPITLCIMCQPAVTPSGHTYEFEALRSWLERVDTSPVTSRPVKGVESLAPNYALRGAIQSFVEDSEMCC